MNVRIRIDLAYDGTDFYGWAAQPGLRTVEDELAEGLATILRMARPSLTVGGRTDAGVHARGSVCHVDVPLDAWQALPGRSTRTPGEAAVTRLVGVLPPDIVVRQVREVPGEFDARFSALDRRYSYRICDHPASVDPLRRKDTVRHKRELDVAAMHEAGQALLGLNDFAAFCKWREGSTTARTLTSFDWHRDDSGVVIGTIVADAFCHSMVRALVGAVVPVGDGRHDGQWPQRLLQARRRDSSLTVMPAHGLCLEEIRYPLDSELGRRAAAARSRRSLADQA